MTNVCFPTLSAKSDESLLKARLGVLQEKFGIVSLPLQEVEVDESWPFYGNNSSRLNQIEEVLKKTPDLIWASRGGYGVSELLDAIKLEQFESIGMVGFSDFSSLLSASYAFNKNSINWHMSMPGGKFWYQQSELTEAMNVLLGNTTHQEIKLNETATKNHEGRLFGGCFSVLTNLIGTSFLPDLQGHILVFEDIEEHPARLMRYWKQWEHAGKLTGVEAVVFGKLVYKDSKYAKFSEIFTNHLKKYSSLPIYTTNEVGHIENSKPFRIGAVASITDGKLVFNTKD